MLEPLRAVVKLSMVMILGGLALAGMIYAIAG
jgi:hypothetical protein